MYMISSPETKDGLVCIMSKKGGWWKTEQDDRAKARAKVKVCIE
jgi:hypothetical protein